MDTGRLVAAVPGVASVGEFAYYRVMSSWALPVTLLAPPGGRTPVRTHWFLVADRRDGAGKLDLFPAVEGGLAKTDHHQAWNGPLLGAPWSSGAICPRSFPAAMARLFVHAEPPSFPARGAWLVAGALRWLDAASGDALVRAGEPFELPAVPTSAPATIIFSESADQLPFWQERIGTAGLVQVGEVRPGGLSSMFTFCDAAGRPELAIRWGAALPKIGKVRTLGAWMALPSLAVMPPWHIPRSWGELMPLLSELRGSREVLGLLRSLRGIHDGQQHLLFLGAPIPAVVDGPPVMFHWLAARMPPLASISPPTRGFRPTDKSRALYNSRVAFQAQGPVEWLQTANWHPAALATRGVHADLAGRRGLLLGAGAFGSAVGEILIRDGLRSLHVFDDDRVHGGNLTRHTALLINVGERKAIAVAARLNLANPHAAVTPHAEEYPSKDQQVARKTLLCDLVVDATAEATVLRALATEERSDALFASIWLGFRGRRTYVYLASGQRFPLADWEAACEPWLSVEREEIARHGHVWEGVGCWSPVFAAHPEDVWEAAAGAVRLIIDALRRGLRGLIVYEHGRDADGLPERRRLRRPENITREPLEDT